MRQPELWGLIGVWHCKCFMLLEVVIRFRFLEEEVKELHGTHGKPTMTLHQHFVLWRPPQSLWRVLLNHWSDLWYCCMTAPVTWNVSTRPGCRSLHRKAALIQHTKWATYQAGYCWGQVMIAAPELPSPSDWGWTRKEPNGWEVNWTTLPEATKACRELLWCGCKKGCRCKCKCLKAALQCTALCHYGGICSEN